MTFDYEATLISQTFTVDAYGDKVLSSVEKKILCSLSSISSSEFYQAHATGLRPEVKIIMWNFEYSGERKIKFEGHEYDVVRTYSRNDDLIEITLQSLVIQA